MNKLRQAILSSAIGEKSQDNTGAVTHRYCFRSDFIGFRGHFPGYPILPALVQILAAIITLEDHIQCRLKLISVEKAKFHLPLHPDHEIEVMCAPRELHGQSICEARLTVAEGLASSFRFTFDKKRDTPC